MNTPAKSQSNPPSDMLPAKAEIAKASEVATRNVPATQQEVGSTALSARTVRDGIAAPTMRSVMMVHGEAAVFAVASMVITKGMEAVAPSRRPSPAMLSMLAEEILRLYPNESLQDINVFVRGVAMGKYDGSEIYSTMDMPRLLSWWRDYLTEKAEAREHEATREEHVLEQGIKRMVGDIDGLSKAIKEFNMDAKEKSEQVRAARRLSKLKADMPALTDHALREAWRIYRAPLERAAIQAEASRRGMMGDEIKAAQDEADRQEDHLARYVSTIREQPTDQLALTRRLYDRSEDRERTAPYIAAIDAELERRAATTSAA